MLPRTLAERFEGCLLGLAVADALGSQFEGLGGETLQRRFESVADVIEHLPPNGLYYTDDTQMAIGVAETLVACGRIDERELGRRFAANYEPHRGYGRGARLILEMMLDGGDHQSLAAELFPGGSYGNGAAMRVAPVGLKFHREPERLWEEARRSALPTHLHPLGIEGAQILAAAVGAAVSTDTLDRATFFAALSEHCTFGEYAGPLRRAGRVTKLRDLEIFGNGIEAASSVVTAIACFGLTPDSYEETTGNAILLGGDTDTIAAMAGALSGAYLGVAAIPQALLDELENGPRGRDYLRQLAQKLIAA